MREDDRGFLYPEVDALSCVECGLCETVCPVINAGESRRPLRVLAAKNPDESVRLASSSGGLFTMLAERVIAEGGVVFGAKFDESWGGVVHTAAESMDEVAALRGSKYVQSVMGDAYQRAYAILRQGRKVLFSGTPCQIAGLKKFLRRDYDNLLTLDVVCHGVPSPLVWREYLKDNFGENVRVVNMRDKSKGWSAYRVKIEADCNKYCRPASENVYIEGFLKDLYLRPSCYVCPSKAGRSGSDITLGDFWGITQCHPDFADDKGVSLALIGSKKGEGAVDGIDISAEHSTYENAVRYNPCIECSVSEPPQSVAFWNLFEKIGAQAIEEICRSMRPSALSRIILRLKTILWHIIHRR